MLQTLLTKVGAVSCAGALVVAVLSGCVAQNAGISGAAQANRTYMTQVNRTMEDLGVDLENFSEAVSRGDVVSMRTQADNAFAELDKLQTLEVPEDMGDIQSNYVEGAQKLKEALNSYIALYTEIEAATEAMPFDWSTYDQRIADIQQLYDQGIAALKAGDEAAAAKE